MAYEFKHEPKDAPRTVSVTEVPADWAKALDTEWGIAKRDQVVPVITFPTAKDAAMHLAYAKAWGLSKQDGHKVTVRKGTARKDDAEGTLRLVMEPFNPNAPKRGRKPAAAA